MKRGKMSPSFLERLKGSVKSLRDMKPGEVHVFSINAHYGHYHIVIGPEQKEGAPQERLHARPIEIDGEIHHLFMSPRAMRIYPSKRQMRENMKDTVILKDLTVHLVDPDGKGSHLNRAGNNELHARECINFAGDDGDRLIEEAQHDQQMTMAAYRIIQRDILQALEEGAEETMT